MVTLAEDLYLLASDGSTGRFLIDTTRLDLGLGGAMLLDLVLRGHLELADSSVVVTAGPPTGEPLLDTALATLTATARRHSPEHWVRNLARGAHRAVQDHLVDVGILRREDEKFLHVIPVHRTHESDGRLHYQLRHDLDDAVILGRPPSRETAALAALTLAVGLDRELFLRSDRHEIRRRMAEIADGHWVAAAVAGEVTIVDVALGLAPELPPLESY